MLQYTIIVLGASQDYLLRYNVDQQGCDALRRCSPQVQEMAARHKGPLKNGQPFKELGPVDGMKYGLYRYYS